MKWLIAALILKALVLGFLIGSGYIGLSPDEAQYWTWSRSLDWGYYSKPPAIAWQMWLTTSLIGQSELGVRLGALIIAFALSLVIYACCRACGLSRQTAFWGALVFAISPLGFYLSFFATTDGGAILFLSLGLFFALKGMRREKGPNYWLMGLMIGLGALFKWTAYIHWPLVGIYLLFFKNWRKWSLLGGILLSLLSLLPTLYWNVGHEWATFKHVAATVGKIERGNFFDFLGAQIVLISPIFFVILIGALIFVWRSRNRGLLFVAAFPLCLLLYMAAAFFKKMQGNWAAYLLPPCYILIAWMACEKMIRGKIWLKVGSVVSLILVIGAFSIPALQIHGYPLSHSQNPFKHMVGWNNIAPSLEQAGYAPDKYFLVGDRYQTTSLLSFYGPKQKRAYFLNLGGARKNQFSYWPQMNPVEVGKDGYFVVLENMKEDRLKGYIENYQSALMPYFSSVIFKGAYPLYWVSGKPVKFALVFEAQKYSGLTPSEGTVY